MKNSKNPFPVTGYHGPDYFCDREVEIKTLEEALSSFRNVTLIAPRRIGKTALIHHLFQILSLQKKDKYNVLYVDIMPTSTFNEFSARLATAVVQAFPDTTSYGKKIWAWIKSVRPQISFDPYTGMPQISFGHNQIDEQQATIHQLFDFLETNGNKKTIVALDEFQQILHYPEQQTEAWLRSEIQNLKSTGFIFCGSQQQIISEMFNSSKRPFYASTQTLVLSYIEKELYHGFIENHMTKSSRFIDPIDLDYILEWGRVHTYYVQLICNRLFSTGEKTLTRELINNQLNLILKENETIFFSFRELLTSPQWTLLKAIAKEGKVYAPTSQLFLRTHGLGTPATVKRSLDSLLHKEMIFKSYDNGRPFYQVYDVLLSRWLESV